MRKPKVLIIDDDIDLVEIIRVTLESASYEVIDAQNGMRGVALAREEHPDVILLDVMMDAIDEGFHVAYELRKAPETKDLPLLMMTAVTERTGLAFNPERDGDYLPVDEYLEKPISPRRLLELVGKYAPAES